MHEYIYPYRMLPGAILEFYDSVTMYLAHSIRKNKVKVDLEILFLLHVNNGDRCDSFGDTTIEKLSQAVKVVDILREIRPVFPRIFRISLLHVFFLLLSVLIVFPNCDHFLLAVIEIIIQFVLHIINIGPLITVITMSDFSWIDEL